MVRAPPLDPHHRTARPLAGRLPRRRRAPHPSDRVRPHHWPDRAARVQAPLVRAHLEEMEQDALSAWLLDRLEDARFWPAGDPRILSVRAVTDSARHDADFLAVAELFAGRAAFDLDALVSTLVAGEVRALPRVLSATPKPACASARLGKRPGRSSVQRTPSTPSSPPAATSSFAPHGPA